MLFPIPEFSPNLIIALFTIRCFYISIFHHFCSRGDFREQEPGQRLPNSPHFVSRTCSSLKTCVSESLKCRHRTCYGSHIMYVTCANTEWHAADTPRTTTKKRKWRVAAFSSDKCRDVMCHGGSAGNATTWITKIYISSQNRALIDARGDARCSLDMTKLSGYVMRRRQSVNTQVRM